MASLTLEIRNLPHILGKLEPRLYLPALAELLKDAATLGERVAREGAPYDTGALKRSITSEAKPMMARVYSPLVYASVMEEGRRAGARMPPPNALVGWLGRHGISASAAFVIARAIGRRGIKGRFFMKAAMQAVSEAFPSLGAKAAAKIAREWES